MKWTSPIVITLLQCVLQAVSAAEEVTASLPAAGDESIKYRAEVVIDGLENPCGLVARPRSERGAPLEILFVESGAGRVLGCTTEEPKETREVLTGLVVSKMAPLDTRASGWSLGFVTPTKLAVLGGLKSGADRVGVFVLPAEDTPLAADKLDHEVVIAGDKAAGIKPLFGGVTFGDTACYVSNGAVESAAQIYRAGLAANRMESPQPLLNLAESQRFRWPAGLCLSPSTTMHFLVTVFAGELTDRQDSRVVFFAPSSGRIALELAVGLRDVVGLVYSPAGQLYAVDLAWHSKDSGGVYRLDDVRHRGQPACRAVKIAEVARPTSMLFGDSGTLYVTAWGTGSDSQGGTIVKITGEF